MARRQLAHGVHGRRRRRVRGVYAPQSTRGAVDPRGQAGLGGYVVGVTFSGAFLAPCFRVGRG